MGLPLCSAHYKGCTMATILLPHLISISSCLSNSPPLFYNISSSHLCPNSASSTLSHSAINSPLPFLPYLICHQPNCQLYPPPASLAAQHLKLANTTPRTITHAVALTLICIVKRPRGPFATLATGNLAAENSTLITNSPNTTPFLSLSVVCLVSFYIFTTHSSCTHLI